MEPTDKCGELPELSTPLTLVAHTENIVERLEQRLRIVDSPLLAVAGVRDQFAAQVRSILCGVASRLAGPVPTTSEPAATGLSVEIGAARANAGIHPRDSLRAATLLFEVTLPVVLRELCAGQQTIDTIQAAALALHAEIMGRVSMAAVPYVSRLLQRMHTSQFGERQRIARDLHDGVAHAVGVAMQQLELYDAHLELNPEAARPRLLAAQESLDEALGAIRALSAELGSSPTEGGLDKALARYLDTFVPPAVRAELVCSGNVQMVPAEVGDQLYFVIREAVRNALLHAGTAELRVTLNITDHVVSAAVEDFGRGLDIAAAMEASHRAGSGTGLTSMQERVELLGGVFTLSSGPGQGALVEILIPLLTVRR